MRKHSLSWFGRFALVFAGAFVSCDAPAPESEGCVPDGRTGWVCSSDSPGFVYFVNSCFEIIEGVPPKRCLNDKVCLVPTAGGDAYCGVPGEEMNCVSVEGVCSCPAPSPPILGCLEQMGPGNDDFTTLAEVDACGQITNEVAHTCADGEYCWYTWNEDGSVNEAAGAHCANSMVASRRDSPFYRFACDVDMYMHAQTEMYMDCRCNRSTREMQECRPGADAWTAGLRFGTGPHMHGINFAKWGPGFIHEGELYAPVHYIGGGSGGLRSGAIYAIDIETGNRRVVSGAYLDDDGIRVDVGSGHTVEGEALPFITSIKLGEDGMIYAVGSNTLTHVEITRVDPTTGERTQIWRRQPLEEASNADYRFGQCFDGRVSINYYGGFEPVQYAERAFALGPDGTFYLGWNNDGVGVVQISADGSTCTHVSRWASRNLTAPLPDIGGGTTPQYGEISGMLYREGAIYAQTKGITLSIDPATGDRSIFSNVTGTGETSFFVDEDRELFFACGSVGSRLCSVHTLADGNVAQDLFRIGQGMPVLVGKYPQVQGAKGALDNDNYNGYGAVAVDPNDDNIMYFVVLSGVIAYEVDTGNSHFISM